MKNLEINVCRFLNEVIKASPLTPSVVAEIYSKQELNWYAPALVGSTMLPFKFIGDTSSDGFKSFAKWWRCRFDIVPYWERLKTGAVFWIWIKLPDSEKLRASDYESFCAGLNEAYQVFDSTNPKAIRRFDLISAAPYPLPLVFRDTELEPAYQKLRAAQLSYDAFTDTLKYAENAFRFNLESKAHLVKGEAVSLFSVVDSEHTRIWKVVRYLMYRDMKSPTILDVENFWRSSGLVEIDNAGGFDLLWQNEVVEALETIEGQMQPEKLVAKAAKYKLGMWQWLIEARIEPAKVEAEGLSFPELEVVLGLITKSVASPIWKGASNRDGLLSFIEKTKVRHGLKIDKNKSAKLVKLLVDAELIEVAEEAHSGKNRVYGLGVKHPMYAHIKAAGGQKDKLDAMKKKLVEQGLMQAEEPKQPKAKKPKITKAELVA